MRWVALPAADLSNLETTNRAFKLEFGFLVITRLTRMSDCVTSRVFHEAADLRLLGSD